jgi:aspartate racemase
MKTVGIVGGIAPESTIEYYRFIIAKYREKAKTNDYPPIVINSIDLTKMLSLVAANQLDELIQYLLNEIQKLARAGADFAVLASNTPHIVFNSLRERSPIPLVSIVETTAKAAKSMGLTKLGLFGTRFTMGSSFYPQTFLKEHIEIVIPHAEEQAIIHDKYMGELVRAIFLSETRDALLGIAERMVRRDQIDGLILGGTELPILLRDSSSAGIPFLDTTKIHVEAIVSEMLS